MNMIKPPIISNGLPPKEQAKYEFDSFPEQTSHSVENQGFSFPGHNICLEDLVETDLQLAPDRFQQMAMELAQGAGLSSVPIVYISSNLTLTNNAGVAFLNGEPAIIFGSHFLIDEEKEDTHFLTDPVVMGVLAHEMGHIKNEDLHACDSPYDNQSTQESRDMESAADITGALILNSADYSPAIIAHTLSEISPNDSENKPSTHPETRERIKNIESMSLALQKTKN